MGLMYLIQGMQSAGVDVYSRLKQIGIDAEQLDPQALIPRTLEWHIQHHIGQGLGVDPLLGLKGGQHYTLAGYGPLLMFLMTANDVKQALSEAMQFQELTYVFGKLSHVIEAKHLGLIYQPLDVTDDMALFRTISEISGTHRFIRDIYAMTGLPEYPIQVNLPFVQPEQLSQLEIFKHYFGDSVQFGFKQAEFWIDGAILQHKLASADEIMHEVYRQRCQVEKARMYSHDGEANPLIEQIQDYLSLQKERMPSLAEIARVLQIPERTLRYQLSLHKTSFQKIREVTLREKAKSLLLDHHHTIEKIANLLGYAETASFNHAFKRWFGISPKQYQQQYQSSS